MSDLVERLRGMANVPDVDFDSATINEAADRIEALEAALREIINVEVIDPWSAAGTMQIKARAALAPEKDK
jgi:hypothetical protein